MFVTQEEMDKPEERNRWLRNKSYQCVIRDSGEITGQEGNAGLMNNSTAQQEYPPT